MNEIDLPSTCPSIKLPLGRGNAWKGISMSAKWTNEIGLPSTCPASICPFVYLAKKSFHWKFVCLPNQKMIFFINLPQHKFAPCVCCPAVLSFDVYRLLNPNTIIQINEWTCPSNFYQLSPTCIWPLIFCLVALSIN